MPRSSPQSQVCAGNLQAACQAAFPVQVGYRVASSPAMLDVTACAFAPTTTSTCAGASSSASRYAMYQGLALPGQKLLGLAEPGAPARSQHDDRMRVSHLPCALRHCCSCAAMLSEIASGPRPPMSRPTGDRSLGERRWR